MRRLTVVLLWAAALWSGWWLLAVLSLQAGLQGWLDQQRARGWQAEVLHIDRGGYPLHLRVALQDLALADPMRGVALGFDRMTIHADAWWPFHARLTFPETPMSIAAPDGGAQLEAEEAAVLLRLHPGGALELSDMSVTSGPWALTGAAGPLLSATDLHMDMKQRSGHAARYDITTRATSLSPGAALRASLRVPESWPESFDALTLNMEITFDRPWDLAAIEGARPQPRVIALRLAEAAWGPALLRASADLIVDGDGVAEGTLALQARNWRDLLVLAEASGQLPPGLRPQVERALSALAGASGNPETIDVTLNLSGGLISLGFLPIAQAPRFLLR